MQNKRKRILTMLENGAISTDEALTLLENLGKSKQDEHGETSGQTEEPYTETQTADDFEQAEEKQNNQKSSQQDAHSMDDFLEDLRHDFTKVGDRFMQFMQTAVQKVKEFDFEAPFGQSVTFTHTMTKSVDEIDELIMDIDNGKVAIHFVEEEEARAEFTVKVFNSDSEATAKGNFIDKMLFVTDNNKLRVASSMKMTQVNLDLYLPKKVYKKLSVRLMNGTFKMDDAEINKVQVKTANGKIEVSKLVFKDAEFETANGAVKLNKLKGETLTTETLNGRIYIDGSLKDIEAQSLSGSVVVTTTSEEAEKIEAKTMSGAVEIYIPSSLALSGEILSNMGKLDLKLDDVNRSAEQEQLLHRSIRFSKEVESKSPLHIFGEAKTGSVLVCYNAE